MSRKLVNSICKTFPGAEVSDPWGGGHDAWKVGGKMFACIGAVMPGVSVKTDGVETAQMLIDAGVGVKVLYFHRSWVNLPGHAQGRAAPPPDAVLQAGARRPHEESAGRTRALRVKAAALQVAAAPARLPPSCTAAPASVGDITPCRRTRPAGCPPSASARRRYGGRCNPAAIGARPIDRMRNKGTGNQCTERAGNCNSTHCSLLSASWQHGRNSLRRACTIGAGNNSAFGEAFANRPPICTRSP